MLKQKITAKKKFLLFPKAKPLKNKFLFNKKKFHHAIHVNISSLINFGLHIGSKSTFNTYSLRYILGKRDNHKIFNINYSIQTIKASLFLKKRLFIGKGLRSKFYSQVKFPYEKKKKVRRNFDIFSRKKKSLYAKRKIYYRNKITRKYSYGMEKLKRMSTTKRLIHFKFLKNKYLRGSILAFNHKYSDENFRFNPEGFNLQNLTQKRIKNRVFLAIGSSKRREQAISKKFLKRRIPVINLCDLNENPTIGVYSIPINYHSPVSINFMIHLFK